jgi:hypothetical protein
VAIHKEWFWPHLNFCGVQSFVAPSDAVGGHYSEDCAVCEVNDDTTSRAGVRSYALNPRRAEELWRKSQEMVGERFPL